MARKGEKVINMNYAAVDKGVEMVEEAEVPARWADIEIPEEKVMRTCQSGSVTSRCRLIP